MNKIQMYFGNIHDCMTASWFISRVYLAYANSLKITTMTFKIKQSESVNVNRHIIMSVI